MIVVDAAVIVDVVTNAPGADQIAPHLSGEDLYAPHLIDIEVVSALRGLLLGDLLTPARAMDALTDYDDLTITRWPADDHQRRSMLRLRHNVSAYDAAYVALALSLGCPLVTRDRRLGRLGLPEVDIAVL